MTARREELGACALLVMDVQRGIVDRVEGPGPLLEKVFPRQAEVLSVDAWIARLG